MLSERIKFPFTLGTTRTTTTTTTTTQSPNLTHDVRHLTISDKPKRKNEKKNRTALTSNDGTGIEINIGQLINYFSNKNIFLCTIKLILYWLNLKVKLKFVYEMIIIIDHCLNYKLV